MFGLSTGELLLIAAAAALAVGPRELPKIARSAGFVVGSSMRLLGQGRAALDQLSRTSELRALHQDVRSSIDQLYAIRNDIRYGVHAMPTGSTEPPPSSSQAAAPEAQATATLSVPVERAGPQADAFVEASRAPLDAPVAQAPPAAALRGRDDLQTAGQSRAAKFASPASTDAMAGGADFVADAFAFGHRPPSKPAPK